MTSLNTNYGRVKNHKLSDIIIIMIFPRNLAILAIMLLKQRERDTPADVSGIVRNVPYVSHVTSIPGTPYRQSVGNHEINHLHGML